MNKEVRVHKKHAKMKKPGGGNIHRNEFAIIGAPCDIIQQLSKDLAEKLSQYKVGYVDAAHGGEDVPPSYAVDYTDKIGFHQLHFHSNHTEYEFRSLFNASDLVLINGNHFKGANQLVIINQKKKESLEKKLDRLTSVLAFVLDEGEEEVHDYLKSDFEDVPIIKMKDVDAIAALIESQLNSPVIKGLVLAGGKSMRMGEDKGFIDYHGKPQREYAADLLAKFCEEVFISVAKGERTSYPTIMDSFTDLGPYGGILSAFRHDPDAAWLIVATDIPLLDEATLQYLLDHRSISKVATSFHNPETNFPEPLITLWEPRAYPRLLSFLSLGYSCPRKVLINSEIEELKIDQPDFMLNANTPEERKLLMKKING